MRKKIMEFFDTFLGIIIFYVPGLWLVAGIMYLGGIFSNLRRADAIAGICFIVISFLSAFVLYGAENYVDDEDEGDDE